MYGEWSRAYDAWRTAGPSEHGAAESEPAAPRCADCFAEEVPMVTLDGSTWCRSCVRAALPDMGETERAEAVAALAGVAA